MLPFINFFGRQYPTIILLGLVGFFLAVFAAGFRSRRYNLMRSDPVYIGTFAGFGLLLGASLLFAFTQMPRAWANRAYFFEYPMQFLIYLFGGLVFYGGLFGAVGGIFLYCKIMKQPFGTVMKLTVPVLPLAHAVMRIGCFAGGCCYGIEHRFGIAFTNSLGAPNGIPLLPVQLFEAAVNLIIFAVLWTFTRKDREWALAAAMYGLMYSFSRFWLEFLRGDAIRGFAFGLSTSQIISILVFLACLVYIYVTRMYRTGADA